MSIEACPLCNWVEVQGSKVDEDVLLDHIAKDVHSFSLRSLPWADDNGEVTDIIMSQSKSKVDSWLINNVLLNESLEEAQEAQATKADASDYFQHNAYFADSSVTSTSSDDESVISMERELEKLKQMDGSLSFRSITEARSDYEANAIMDVSDTKPCQSQMVSDEEIAQLWRINTVKCIMQLKSSGIITSVTFSHDSSLIASGSSDKTVRLWRTDTGECIQMLEGHSNSVLSVVFSHDSSLIASGSDDRTVRLWRTDTGECIQTLEGHSGSVRSVVFSHDSSLIASGSRDITVRLWRTDTGECIQTLEGHSGSVRSVVFSHDSTLIASGSDDGTVRLWSADNIT